MTRAFLAFCLGLFAALAGPAPASGTRQGVAELRQGYFCALEPVAIEEAAGTLSGVVLLVDSLPPFIAEGTAVPAQIGVGFGVHVRVRPEYAGPVTIVVEHPPMGPAGTTRESWNTTLSADDTRYTGFAFEHDYELVTGRWTMAAEVNGRRIYKVGFDVLPPVALPPVNCNPEIPLS